MVEPAAINDLSPKVTGATKLVLQPINESLPMIVLIYAYHHSLL